MKARGFTLIELLIAIIILALISVAAYRGLNAVLQTRERIVTETRKWQQLALFFARLDQDIAQASKRPAREPGGLAKAEWLGAAVVVGEDEAALTFTRAGIGDQGTTMMAPQRIGYRLVGNTIMLLRWPFPDAAPYARPIRYPLLEGISEMQFQYLDVNGAWSNTWPPIGQVATQPMALEIALTLTSGEKITRMFALQ